MTLTTQNIDGGIDFKNIDPLNMEKRVRVFVEQLLPSIVIQANSREGMKFAYDEIGRLGFKFINRLEHEDMFNEIAEVQASIHYAISELSTKYRELVEREQGISR